MSSTDSPSLEILQAVYAAVRQKLTATSFTAMVEAEHAVKRLVLGDSEELQAGLRYLREGRAAAPAAVAPTIAPVVTPPPARPSGRPGPPASLFG